MLILCSRFIQTPIMSAEAVERLDQNGVKFAKVEDASKAVQHLAADGTLHGRAISVVTRDVDPRGYVDLGEWNQDDFQEGGLIDTLTRIVSATDHRTAR